MASTASEVIVKDHGSGEIRTSSLFPRINDAGLSGSTIARA